VTSRYTAIIATRPEKDMRHLWVFACILITGCSYATNPHAAGTMLPDGSIAPCHGNHTDSQACGNATFNATVINQVQPGQSKEQVRAIMRHDAERREITGNSETWLYITDYGSELMTAITFTDGKVTGLKQAPWHSQ
jgi:hypothetical protein